MNRTIDEIFISTEEQENGSIKSEGTDVVVRFENEDTYAATFFTFDAIDKLRMGNKNWILFFDEADALFGKRTNVRDAHDKYANQEVAYLLQRIENYPGLTILTSNFKSNIDDAFTRRFQSIIYFPVPKAAERLLLWEKAFPEKVEFASDVDFQSLARQYELTGSNIMNIVQYACLCALEEETEVITLAMIQEGVDKEYEKEGKIL